MSESSSIQFPGATEPEIYEQEEEEEVQSVVGHHMITRAKYGIFKPKIYLSTTSDDQLHEESGIIEEDVAHEAH